jgi:hypothetical protein
MKSASTLIAASAFAALGLAACAAGHGHDGGGMKGQSAAERGGSGGGVQEVMEQCRRMMQAPGAPAATGDMQTMMDRCHAAMQPPASGGPTASPTTPTR